MRYTDDKGISRVLVPLAAILITAMQPWCNPVAAQNGQVLTSNAGEDWYRETVIAAGGRPAKPTDFGLPPFGSQGVKVFYAPLTGGSSEEAFSLLKAGARCAQMTGQPLDGRLNHASSMWNLDLSGSSVPGMSSAAVKVYNCRHPNGAIAERYLQIALCTKDCGHQDARATGMLMIMRGSLDARTFEDRSAGYLREISDHYKHAREASRLRQRKRDEQAEQQSFESWRRFLAPGDAIAGGMLLELKPPLARVQLCQRWIERREGKSECLEATTLWRRIGELEPPR